MGGMTNKLPKTAEDWQLYDLPGAQEAAKDLTSAMVEGIQSGNYYKAYKLWCAAADKHSKFGACDTEPRNVFLDYIESYFGVEL
jgi:hypothetical protein